MQEGLELLRTFLVWLKVIRRESLYSRFVSTKYPKSVLGISEEFPVCLCQISEEILSCKQ